MGSLPPVPLASPEQIGIAIVENNMEVSQKARATIRPTYDSIYVKKANAPQCSEYHYLQ